MDNYIRTKNVTTELAVKLVNNEREPIFNIFRIKEMDIGHCRVHESSKLRERIPIIIYLLVSAECRDDAKLGQAFAGLYALRGHEL